MTRGGSRPNHEHRGGLLNSVSDSTVEGESLLNQQTNQRCLGAWCFPLMCLPDMSWVDFQNLICGRWRDFRFRRERRLFDKIDDRCTGYVTLDEIINFRERMQALHGSDPVDVPMLDLQPDLTRSLVALYHFDVQLDGKISFDEFLLLQARQLCNALVHPFYMF
mmetsp:Transcript_71312/g.190407  ORF Transcript_71312/g.190407 Transcript_71312/m.190407 type:complete len:164 (+) Transcript_71312:327-818(+)